MSIDANVMMRTRIADLAALKELALMAAEMRAVANNIEVHWREQSAGFVDILYGMSSLWGKVSPGYADFKMKKKRSPEVQAQAGKYYNHYYSSLLNELSIRSQQVGVGKSTIDIWVSKLQTQIKQDRKYILSTIRDVQAINQDAFAMLDSCLAVCYYSAATTKVLADLGSILVGGWIGKAVNLTWTLTATGIGFASPIIVDLVNNWDDPQKEELILGVTLPKGTQTQVASELGNSILGLVCDDVLLKPVEMNVWQIPRQQALSQLAQNVNQGVMSHSQAASNLGRIKNLSDNMRSFQTFSKVASSVGTGLQIFSIYKSVKEFHQNLNAF